MNDWLNRFVEDGTIGESQLEEARNMAANLGIPVEDYGFSNNASGLFGPPSWEDAKFRFSDNNKIVEIVID